MFDSYDIERVSFVRTVRWPGKGPVDALTNKDWVECSESATGALFFHISGTFVFIPWANIRWIQGEVPAVVAEPSIENVTPLPKRRGRPPKR